MLLQSLVWFEKNVEDIVFFFCIVQDGCNLYTFVYTVIDVSSYCCCCLLPYYRIVVSDSRLLSFLGGSSVRLILELMFFLHYQLVT